MPPAFGFAHFPRSDRKIISAKNEKLIIDHPLNNKFATITFYT